MRQFLFILAFILALPVVAHAGDPPICAAKDIPDGPRHVMIVNDPPRAKEKGEPIPPAGKGAAEYVYAAIAQARGIPYAGHETIHGVPAPIVHLIEASSARGEAKVCLETIKEYQDDAQKFDGAWKAYQARRVVVDKALADAGKASPAEAETILTAVITPPPEGGTRGRLEPMDAETDALLALIPAVKATKHYALLGDIAHGLAVRRHTTADEAEERMLWLVAHNPQALRMFADAAAGVGARKEYVAAMNVASQRLRASQDFGRETLAGIVQHRALLGLNYVDLLDTNSAKPGDVVVVYMNNTLQVTDKTVALDIKNSWDQAYDCKTTAQVCSWQWNGGNYDAIFCQECKYKKVQAHLAAKLALSAPPPDWARAGKTGTLVARVVSAKKLSATEATWSFADAQIIDDRFAAALLSPHQ